MTRMFSIIAAAIVLFYACTPAVAQSYPQRPIRMLVGLPAGGSTDIMGRLIAAKIGERLGQQVVNVLMMPGTARERLTKGVFVPKNETEAVGALEAALVAVIAAEKVEAKIRAAVKAGTLQGRADTHAAKAVLAGVIGADEAAALDRAQQLRRRVIMVDDFPRDLGKTEIFQTTQAVTYEALQRG